MERVESLINKLALQSLAKAPAADLLQTTELLYAALKGVALQQTLSVNAGVAVWLPAGYSANSSKVGVEPHATKLNDDKRPVPPEPPVSLKTPAAEPLSVPVQPGQDPQLPGVPVPVVLQAPKVPMPPQVVAVPEAPAVETSVAEPAAEAGDLAEDSFTLHVQYDEEELAQMVEAEMEEPAIVEQAPEPPAVVIPAVPKPFPQYPDAATLMKSIFPVAPDPAPVAREINQLVPDPAAVALNERLMEKKVELAEVLSAGPKLTDLRKAFTINDKYQMINSLFRGDEDMFERSVRTLNNFGSLPEARFWMQRELVVKLGWNEKDEMVQHFQKLVNRRFA